jgi:hypothetical protein
MSHYYIGKPDQQNHHRFQYNVGVSSSEAIMEALRGAGFTVAQVPTTATITPYLVEIDIAKEGAMREDVEAIMRIADTQPEPSGRR